MGSWLYEPERLRSLAMAVTAASGGPRVYTNGDGGAELYRVSPEGLGVVNIHGTMMKRDSKFGGTSTIRVRRALRAMVADQDVRAILISIDSGGGTAAGTDSLGDEIAAAAAAKPTAAHIEDIGASAALWAATQATRVSASRMAFVGSVGTVAVIEDLSGAYERDGIVVHVITSDGAETFKAAGVDGTKITAEQLAEWRNMVNQINELFLEAISRGRRLPMEKVRAIADGRLHISHDAARLGLIDEVETIDEAAAAVLGMARAAESSQRRLADSRARLSRARLDSVP